MSEEIPDSDILEIREDSIEPMLEDDEIDAREAGFLFGYHLAS
jgi:hypothetical protein